MIVKLYYRNIGTNDAHDLFTNPAHARLERGSTFTTAEIIDAHYEHVGTDKLGLATECEWDDYWTGFWQTIEVLATVTS